MSILGILYKVEGFPQLFAPGTQNNVLNISSNEKGSENVNTGVSNYVAVPIKVNLAPAQSTRPQRLVQCCSKSCLLKINTSHRIALKRMYNKINSKDEQYQYLMSLRRSCSSSTDKETQETDGNLNHEVSTFLVPAEGKYQSSMVCKSAFRYIYGLSLATLNNLLKVDSHSSNRIQTEATSKIDRSPVKQSSVCDICGRTFSSVYVMRHHRSNLCSQQRLAAKKCQFQGCEQKFHHTTRLAAHMRDVHRANIEPERHLKFSSEAEFLSWKHSEETRTFSLFTQNTGTRKLISSRVTLYACQRDGRDRAHVRKGQPARKTERRRAKGRVKSNITCVAYMKAEIHNSGVVQVLYSPSHSHPLKLEDTVNHPITPKVKAAVEKKLEQGYAPKEILRKLKSQSTTHSISSDKVYVELEGRLVNQRVVSALARGKYPSAQHLHANDSKAVALMLEQLKKQQPSPLLALLEFSSHVKAHNPLFIVLQSPNQLTLFETHLSARKSCVLYITDLEAMSSWDLVIYSALISDDLVGAVPVAFCLTNQRDYMGLADFIKVLKTQVPQMWNNISTVFVPPQLANHARKALAQLEMSVVLLLSVRHTLRAMQTLLTCTVSPAVQQQLNQCLPRIVSAKNKSQFLEELKTLRALVSTSPESLNFLKKFESLYLSRPGEWALCVRDPSLHVSDYGESFHNYLLEYHQTQYAIKRLDDVISTLLKVGNEVYSEKSQRSWKKEIERRQQDYQNHMEMESDIQVLDTSLPGQWEVKKINSDISAVVTATGSIVSSPVPGPLDYHCTCLDVLPLCCHILNVHAMQHGTVSDILVPEPSNSCDLNEKLTTSNEQEVIFIDVYGSQDTSQQIQRDSTIDTVKFIPDIKNLASSKTDGKNDICFEVVIETSSSIIS